MTTFSTPSERELAVTRDFDAPRELVFDAWTKPEHITSWMLGPEGWTMPVCEVDLRPGGAWRFVWRGAGGKEMGMDGVYREVAPPERMVFTEPGAATGPRRSTPSVLAEEDDGTRLTYTMLYSSTRRSRRGVLDGDEGRHERRASTRLAAHLG